jgi:hypothetical protein
MFSIVVLGFSFDPVRWHVCTHSSSSFVPSPLVPTATNIERRLLLPFENVCFATTTTRRRDQVEEESPDGAARCRTTTTTSSAMTSGEEENAAVAAAVAAVSPGRPMQEEGQPDAVAADQQHAAATATAEMFQWTPPLVVYAMTIFILTGCAEIMGGWLVYSAVVRDDVMTTTPMRDDDNDNNDGGG